MKKQQFIEMQEYGSCHHPESALTNYRSLGLNETEFILLLNIKMHLERGSYFPTPKECRKICRLILKNAQT